MKVKWLAMALIILGAFSFQSCERSVDGIVNGFGDSLLYSLEANPKTDNSKEINFVVNYSGPKTISSVDWEFGDGEKLTTVNKSTTHLYNNVGTFNVIANAKANNGELVVTLKKTVTIQ